MKQVWTAGQVIGLIHDIPTCAELLSRIEWEAAETLSKTASLYTSGATDAASDTQSSKSTSNSSPEDQKVVKSGDRLVESGSGTKGTNVNDPGAELWGVGKSKL